MAGGFRALPLGFFYRVFRTWRLASPRAGKVSQGAGEVGRRERERERETTHLMTWLRRPVAAIYYYVSVCNKFP